MFKRLIVSAGAGAAAFVIAMPAAFAATSWSATTTGAHGSGTYSVTNATYTFNYHVEDTKADGHCVYVRFVPQYYGTPIPGTPSTWSDAGYAGQDTTDRIDNCSGNGTTKSGSDVINVANRMNSVELMLASQIRVEIKVCREIKGVSRDNCSTTITDPKSI